MKKKLFAFILAAAMTLGMSMSVFAAEDPAPTGNYSITVTPQSEATVTHVFDAYQVFYGDLSKKGDTLSNIHWGSGISGEFVFKGEKYSTAVDGDAARLAKVLSTEQDAKDLAESVTFTNVVAGSAEGVVTKNDDGTYTRNNAVIQNLAAGYYIVKDRDGSLDGKNDSYSNYMVQVVGNATVTAKADVPSTQKKVKDVNDSTGEATDYQDSADYDIGDAIPFQFSSTVVSNIDAYSSYVYTFHDKEDAGLTFNKDSVVVKLGDTTLNSNYTVNVTDSETETFSVAVDLKAAGAKAGQVVTVEYTSTLNEKAVIGAVGNKNKMYLEYSNNPNGDGTGKTKEDVVIVFTYKVDVNKFDENNEPLTGADFSVEKKLANGSWKVLTVEKNTSGDVFTVKGIDDGEYRLKETVTPNGYNTISDKYVYFTVTAEHDVLSDSPALKSLTANAHAVDANEALVGTYKFLAQEGTLSTGIVNQSGAILPSTGGIGTTIFYIVGGLLVVVAGSVIFVRKRMSREEY